MLLRWWESSGSTAASDDEFEDRLPWRVWKGWGFKDSPTKWDWPFCAWCPDFFDSLSLNVIYLLFGFIAIPFRMCRWAVGVWRELIILSILGFTIATILGGAIVACALNIGYGTSVGVFLGMVWDIVIWIISFIGSPLWWAFWLASKIWTIPTLQSPSVVCAQVKSFDVIPATEEEYNKLVNNCKAIEVALEPWFTYNLYSQVKEPSGKAVLYDIIVKTSTIALEEWTNVLNAFFQMLTAKDVSLTYNNGTADIAIKLGSNVAATLNANVPTTSFFSTLKTMMGAAKRFVWLNAYD